MGKKLDFEPEKDWDGIVRRQISFECKEFDDETRSFDVVASTAALDSHGDIVEQIFDLKRYKANPVVLWLHNMFGWLDGSRPEDFLSVGHSTKIKIEGGQLTCRIHLILGTEEEEPFIGKLWRRIKQGAQRGISIGFRPGRITEEKVDGGTVYRLSDNELYEISIVPIPSNPEAVAKAAGFEREQLRRLYAAQTQKTATEDTTMAMTPEEQKIMNELSAKVGTLESDLAKAKGEGTTAARALEEKSAEVAKLSTDLTAEKSKVTELEGTVAKLTDDVATAEVDALVGKKISPANRDEMLELRKSNKPLFDKMIAKAADLTGLETDVTKTGEGGESPNKPRSKSSGGALASKVSKKAEGASA